MFDRYTEDARKVIFLARYEASRLGSPVLETGHLWLALLRHNRKLVKRLSPRVTEESILQLLPPSDPNAERVSMTVEIPLSDQARRALTSAIEEADGHGQKYITAEFLALGLLKGTPPAAE